MDIAIPEPESAVPHAVPDAPDIVWSNRQSQIPKEVFVSAPLFEAELKTIFYGDLWHPVGHAAEIPNIGDFKTFTLGRVPLLVARGEDDKIRVFYNSCAHRGAQVETSSRGNRREFECPYHRWAFSADGKLIGCPGSKEFSPEFNTADFGLKALRTEEFLGLICVTMGTATPPLEEWMGAPIREALVSAWHGDGRLRLLGYQKVRYASNWKAYNDNDGYHAPLLHSAFRLLNWQGGLGRQVAMPNGHLSIVAELKPASGNGFLHDPSLIEFRGADPKNGSCVVQLFPFTVMVKHLDVINLRFAIARNHEETEVHYAYFAHQDDDEAMVRHRMRQSSNLLGPAGVVSMEDAALFERMHIGTYTPGFAEFQKGVAAGGTLPATLKQNDESGQLLKWEYYRQLMGFPREP